MALAKKDVTAFANLLYRTKALVGPTRDDRVYWNELRQKFRDVHIPEQYQEHFDSLCPQFTRP